jgi:hypothetical protein
MKWILYRTYPNLVLKNWGRSKKEVVNTNNWSRTKNYPFSYKEVTIPTTMDKDFAVKQLALANDLYGNLKPTPSPPSLPPRDHPQLPYNLRLTF